MEYILSIIWTCLDITFFMFFSKAFLTDTKTPKQQFLACFLSVLATCLTVFLCSSPLLQQCLSFIFLLTLSFFLFEGSLVAHILISVVCIAFGGIFVTVFCYGACALLGISYEVLVWRKLTYTAIGTICKLFSLLFAWLVFRFRKKSSMQTINPKWLALTLIFPIVSLVMLFITFLNYQDQDDLSIGAFVFAIGLAVSNIAILYLIQHLESQAKEEQEIALLNQQMAIQTESIIALEQSYRAQRKATHDFNNHLETMQRLFNDGSAQALKEYLDSLQKTQSNRILYMNSHHSIIDAVMNQKCQVAMDADIDIQVQVNDLSGVTVKTDMLVVLLSNLLDNAIEACLRIDTERTIQCKLILDGSAFFVSVRNTSLPVTIVDNTIETSKTPKQDHGYGINNIRRILEQLNAEYSFSYADGCFHFVSEIPN